MSLPFRRVTAGLRGGAKRVAGIAELAAWLLLVNGAPGRGRFCPSLKRLLAVGGLCWPCWVIRGCLAESAMFLPFRRVTAGLKGGAKRVAGIAELAAWLLLVKGAPGRGRFCPSRGCWRLVDCAGPAGSFETAWLCECR